jgi:hypothetical protein
MLRRLALTALGVLCIVGIAACDPSTGPLLSAAPSTPTGPAPRGGVYVSVVVLGGRVDATQYVVDLDGVVAVKKILDSVSTSVQFSDVAPGMHVVHLRLNETKCFLSGPDGRPVAVSSGVNVVVVFTIMCGADPILYNRITPHANTTTDFHGGLLAERLVVYVNGIFRLQYTSGRFGDFEYAGTYTSSSPSRLQLAFSDDGRWQAVGTFDANGCLTVAYNLMMALSDFEDGTFCR